MYVETFNLNLKKGCEAKSPAASTENIKHREQQKKCNSLKILRTEKVHLDF